MNGEMERIPEKHLTTMCDLNQVLKLSFKTKLKQNFKVWVKSWLKTTV